MEIEIIVKSAKNIDQATDKAQELENEGIQVFSVTFDGLVKAYMIFGKRKLETTQRHEQPT